MRVLALACPAFAVSARKAAGVPPFLPPFSRVLPPCDFLYIDMHIKPGADTFSCGFLAALPAHQVRLWHLDGAVVFAASCHLAESDNPLLGALFAAGASCVIAGEGENYEGQTKRLYGAGRLGLYVRKGLAAGLPPRIALLVAKRSMRKWMLLDRLLGNKGKLKAARDALDFKVYEWADQKHSNN